MKKIIFSIYILLALGIITICLLQEKHVVLNRVIAGIHIITLFIIGYSVYKPKPKECPSVLELEHELKVIEKKLERVDNSVDEVKLLKRKLHLKTLIKAIKSPIQ